MNSAKLRSNTRSNTLASGCPLLAVVYWLSAISPSAHPGHNLSDATPQHLFTSPDHLAVLALGGVVLWLVGRFVQRQLPRRLLQGAGFAALMTSAVLWGLRA